MWKGKKVNIAFDLDGCLYPWQKAAYSYLLEQGKKLPSYEETWKHFDELVTDDEACYLVSIPILYDKMSPEKRDIEYLHKLSQAGHSIYYITARHIEVETTTELYLDRYNFPQTRNLIFSNNKSMYARLLEIDVFVEDQYKHASKLKNLCKVVIRRQPWNTQYEKEFDYINSIPELDKYL